ncbi:cyclodeaminase/cyclohydrolase family protein [Mariniflexile sp. HNIBRBA6329]|uniref:cyclodeaminase/cyclohydrolase family protein n=1 Tax=Mariniflexile sp. HNIBRBA6329 TaxID=3373088 RepID=UPI0037476476
MSLNLLERTVNDLMEKFGAGNHKPGSGSAAAFQGMVSAKLISTVISLCADEKRKHLYSHCIFELLDFQEQIENRIYPELADKFQFDSEQFDKTINLRKARDNEKDGIIKNQLRRQALEELKVSIAIPLQIASLCKEVAEIAAFVFDNGFKAARGDSQVSLSGSVLAIAGCISIIRLNVLSFNSDEYEYSKSIVSKVNTLELEYKRLNKIAGSKIEILNDEFKKKIPLFDGINKIFTKYKINKSLDIEQCARELQNLLWKNKHLIWKKNIPESYLDILNPEVIFKKALGYDYLSSDRYAVPIEEDGIVEVAGVIDQPNKLVLVSDKFPDQVQRFTAAHELGHAILHKQSILHRDIPTDSPDKRVAFSKVEKEADKFASYFLMPSRLIKKEFEEKFSSEVFQLNETSAFNFGGKSLVDLKRECKTLRDLSRKLASAEFFENKRFESLSKRFGVSIEAMAIRLEELNLVHY